MTILTKKLVTSNQNLHLNAAHLTVLIFNKQYTCKTRKYLITKFLMSERKCKMFKKQAEKCLKEGKILKKGKIKKRKLGKFLKELN